MGSEFYEREGGSCLLVISMAIPMTISMLVNSLYNIIDSFYVAKISEQAMTALSLVYPAQNLLTAVTVGFAIGMNAVIAYYLGAGLKKLADTAATLGLIFNILHGFLIGTICIVGMPAFLGRIFRVTVRSSIWEHSTRTSSSSSAFRSERHFL